ncbi:hypothetical protein KBD69_04480 [Candidatus Woesebacteria bacterium]|nr:hypothetical protein [Candidatus Woesebacteria bacterium]
MTSPNELSERVGIYQDQIRVMGTLGFLDIAASDELLMDDLDLFSHTMYHVIRNEKNRANLVGSPEHVTKLVALVESKMEALSSEQAAKIEIAFAELGTIIEDQLPGLMVLYPRLQEVRKKD